MYGLFEGNVPPGPGPLLPARRVNLELHETIKRPLPRCTKSLRCVPRYLNRALTSKDTKGFFLPATSRPCNVGCFTASILSAALWNRFEGSESQRYSWTCLRLAPFCLQLSDHAMLVTALHESYGAAGVPAQRSIRPPPLWGRAVLDLS